MTMRDLIDMRGASGAVYRFNLVSGERPLSPMGGNFLYVRDKPDGYEVVYVGEAQNLLAESRSRWAEAAKSHGAAHLYTRLNVTERARSQEHADILSAARPPMTPSTEDVS
jgi:hypothetical protein